MPADDVRDVIGHFEAVQSLLRAAMRNTDIDAGTYAQISEARDEALAGLLTLRWFGVGAIHMVMPKACPPHDIMPKACSPHDVADAAE